MRDHWLAPPIDVPHRIARSGRLQSLYKSGYQVALDGKNLIRPELRARSATGLSDWYVYRAGFEAASRWLETEGSELGSPGADEGG